MTVDYMPDDIDVEKFMLFLQQDNPDHREKHYIPNITNDTIWRFRIMRSRANMDNNEAAGLMSDSTVFFASRRFEAVMISVHLDYDDYKVNMMRIMQVLKENKWIAEDPLIKTYGLNTMVPIKDFKFAPITHKIVGCDFWVKKLLNM